MPVDLMARGLAIASLNKTTAIVSNTTSMLATTTDAASTSIPPALQSLVVQGNASAGDPGRALYKRRPTAPSHAGKFQSADGAWWEISESILTPEMFGAKGDGVASDNAALTNMISAFGGGSFFLSGAYRLTSLLSIGLSNCTFRGVRGKTKIVGGFGYGLVRLLECSNVVFEDIIFENTFANAIEDAGSGMIYSSLNNLADISFNRCVFSCPNANTNAIKFIASSVAGGAGNLKTINRVSFTDCIFQSVGRMGIEVINHFDTGTDRYNEITVDRCLFKDNGLSGTFGMAVSLSGKGENCRINNNIIDNPLGIGIEFAGAHDSFACGNFFRNVTRTTALIATSDATAGSRPVTNVTIANNKTDGYQSGASVSLGDISSSYIYGNDFNIGSYVDVKNASNNVFDMNAFKTRGIYGVLYRNSAVIPCMNNVMDRTLVDCSGSAPGSFIACIGHDGATVSRNRFRKGKVVRPGAGNRMGRANGASQNWMEETDFDTSIWSDTLLVITLTGAGPTSLTPEQGQYKTIEFRGTLTANHTIFSDSGPDRQYTVRNATTGGFGIDFRPASGAVGAVVAAGKSAAIALRNASSDAVLIGLFA